MYGDLGKILYFSVMFMFNVSFVEGEDDLVVVFMIKVVGGRKRGVIFSKV